MEERRGEKRGGKEGREGGEGRREEGGEEMKVDRVV